MLEPKYPFRLVYYSVIVPLSMAIYLKPTVTAMIDTPSYMFINQHMLMSVLQFFSPKRKFLPIFLS